MKSKTGKTAGKALLFIVVLIILIAAWVGSYWLKNKQWPWAELKNAINKVNQPAQETKNQETQNQNAQIEKSLEEKKAELFRQGTMNDLATKIGALSPVKPVLGGIWHITRFWFADDRNLYIEYEDGHIMGRILVAVSGAEEKPEYKVIGYFEPGENDWILKTGKDTMAGKELDLYEYNTDNKEWAKKN